MKTFHVWFSTKHRAGALEGEVGESVKVLLKTVAKRTGISIVEMELAVDHVHLLLSLTEEQRLAGAMHQLKGASARSIFLSYPELRLDLGSNSF